MFFILSSAAGVWEKMSPGQKEMYGLKTLMNDFLKNMSMRHQNKFEKLQNYKLFLKFLTHRTVWNKFLVHERHSRMYIYNRVRGIMHNLKSVKSVPLEYWDERVEIIGMCTQIINQMHRANLICYPIYELD